MNRGGATVRVKSRYVSLLLPDLRGGGAERVGVYLANDLVSRGIRVDMVLLQKKGELLPLLDPRVELVSLGVTKLRALLPPLIRYLRSSQPPSLLANMWPLTVLAVTAVALSGTDCKTVLVEHIHWSRTVKDYGFWSRALIRPSMRLLFPLATHCVGVSEGVARDLTDFASLPPGSVTAIANPVTGLPPSEREVEVSRKVPEWANGDHKRIIAIGRFNAQKRFDILLNAVQSVASEFAVKLLILGEGVERDKLERQVEQLGLVDQVFLPGFVMDPRPYLATADLFVLSSDFEGFGNVIAEALEQGCPVVSTDCPSGPREILDDGKYGVLVRVGDADALASAMKEALWRTHDREALRHRARDFSVRKAADAYLNLLLPNWQDSHKST